MYVLLDEAVGLACTGIPYRICCTAETYNNTHILPVRIPVHKWATFKRQSRRLSDDQQFDQKASNR
jgi:hypothetical protein